MGPIARERASTSDSCKGMAIMAYHATTRLGIPIFGSDFWDPHRKQNSVSVFDSKDYGRIFFLEFHC
jgi:hypothetical protein